MARISKTKNNIKKTDLSPYEGKWVAFLGEKIVSNNESLGGLVKDLEDRGLREKSSVFLVPRKDEGPYALFSFNQKHFFSTTCR